MAIEHDERPSMIDIVCDGDQSKGRSVLTLADMETFYRKRVKGNETERLAGINDAGTHIGFGTNIRAAESDRTCGNRVGD
ncbi:hypothetical protein [Aneurinibacillus sp. UBA3580]|uniref:hypothetical protein n=1 Tax=Aneurinibacillus sp. UBA3580 TaxID=1946041 RepID=UPI00257E4862|nr:hypothetical protein [Aneurinibacillus sp. UBA3580]